CSKSSCRRILRQWSWSRQHRRSFYSAAFSPAAAVSATLPCLFAGIVVRNDLDFHFGRARGKTERDVPRLLRAEMSGHLSRPAENWLPDDGCADHATIDEKRRLPADVVCGQFGKCARRR